MPDNIVTIDFRRHLHLGEGDLLLDLGSGNGRHTIEACRWPCRVVSVDIGLEDLRRARFYLRAPDGGSPFVRWDKQEKEGYPGWADFIVADAQHLPFKDGAFNKVMCTEVLEHIPDDKQGISELFRVAKPNADVAVSVPRYWPERIFWTLSWQYWHTPGGHVRMYKPGEMARYLTERGFFVDKMRHRHAFQSIYWFLRCAFGKDNENRFVPRTMWKFINWYQQRRPKRVEQFEATLNLIAGKDLVHYTKKPAAASTNGRQAIEEEAPRARALP
jgi:ubiquinone/menaquinone biosynthesis C-methylase UbiE